MQDAACEAIEDEGEDLAEEDSDESEDEERQEGRRKQIATLEKERVRQNISLVLYMGIITLVTCSSSTLLFDVNFSFLLHPTRLVDCPLPSI